MKSSLYATVLTVLWLLAAGDSVCAKERATVAGLIGAAKSHAEQGRVVDAARALGKAAALAHRHKDLEEEALVARPLDSLLSDLEEAGVWREAMTAVIQELDAKRAGAYVSAHALAREFLLVSSRTGDRTGVSVAASALTTYAAGRRRGKAAKAVAAFGEALVLLGDGEAGPEDRTRAAAALEQALTACVEEHWFETAVAVGTELAIVRLSANDEDRAREALSQVRQSVESAAGYPDREVLILWSDTVRARLPGASNEVLAPYLEAEKVLRDMSAQPGGAGASGAAGDAERCLLAKRWSRLKSRQDLVVVERTGSLHVARPAYVREHEVERPFHTGQRGLVADGIGLAFHGHAVSLEAISLGAVPGAASATPYRDANRAWYLLADGETWTLRKDGQVSIRGP